MKTLSRSSASIQTRVYVWELPVRVAHWLIMLALVVLSVTGYYIYHPFVISIGRASYVMGTMRFTHVVAGSVFLAFVLLRIYWMFRGNRWAHWDQFVPTRRERWKDLIETTRFYSFLRWRPVPNIGHNALAGAAYSVVYALALVEILTGLALYSHILGKPSLAFLVGWLPRLIDIQYLREIHFLVMFAFWMFFLHHIYSSMLISAEEKMGVMESIFSGYKFVPDDLRGHMVSAAKTDQETPSDLLS